MSTHGTSTPVVVNGQATLGSADVANLFAITTSDGWTNASCVEATGTDWVRIFVEWNYFSPNAPSAPRDVVTQPWGFPAILGAANRASVALAYQEVAANIAAARAAGASVILTTKFFPQWVSGPDPGANFEPIVCDLNNVMAPDNALAFYDGSLIPPSGDTRFEPTDYAFYFWLVNLINLYHPASPDRPAIAQGQFVDAIEICNEPNYYSPAGTTNFDAPVSGAGAALAWSTALMMSTAQRVNAQLNAQFAATLGVRGQSGEFTALRMLGPALADAASPTVIAPFGPHGPRELSPFAFCELVLGALREQGFDFSDETFGWSLHNYADIEAIGWRYAALLKQYFVASEPELDRDLRRVEAISDVLAPRLVPHLFGRHGQHYRALLARAGWRGWSDGVHPAVFMTEGGCRIDHMPGPGRRHRVDGAADPDADFATGAVPAAFQRELQRISVGGAAHTVTSRTGSAGVGVAMLTNFLFFDTTRTSRFSTGLLDQYGPNQLPPQANVAHETYARPAFDTWRRFGFARSIA